MKCTSKEWDNCRVEKMGCSGCYYNDDSLEEAKKYLKYKIENNLEISRHNPKDYKSIERVLEELEENKSVIEQLVFTLQSSIPKKKIEDMILQEWQKCPRNSINDFAIVERNNKIKILQEILEG